MFDMMVHRQHKGAERFCCRTLKACWLALFLCPFFKCWGLSMAAKWLRTKKKWRSVHGLSSSVAEMRTPFQLCGNAAICLNVCWPSHAFCTSILGASTKWSQGPDEALNFHYPISCFWAVDKIWVKSKQALLRLSPVGPASTDSSLLTLH